jgi:hypothetical protein
MLLLSCILIANVVLPSTKDVTLVCKYLIVKLIVFLALRFPLITIYYFILVRPFIGFKFSTFSFLNNAKSTNNFITIYLQMI